MASDKGSYRSVYSAIWDDPEFQAFDPLAQSVFLLLRTCRECNFPCIYICYLSTIYERMPGVEREKIDAAVRTLIEARWVAYERPVLWIRKGLRNDPNYVPGNAKQIAGIESILRSLPKLPIVREFSAFYGMPSAAPDIDPSKGHRRGIDGGIEGAPEGASKQGTGTGTGKGTERKAKAAPPPAAKGPPPAVTLPAGVRVETFEAFRTMRKAIKAPLTDYAAMLVVEKLERIRGDTGDDPNAVLEQSIERGWRGVFPLKTGAAGGNADDSWIDELKREREAKKHAAAG